MLLKKYLLQNLSCRAPPTKISFFNYTGLQYLHFNTNYNFLQINDCHGIPQGYPRQDSSWAQIRNSPNKWFLCWKVSKLA